MESHFGRVAPQDGEFRPGPLLHAIPIYLCTGSEFLLQTSLITAAHERLSMEETSLKLEFRRCNFRDFYYLPSPHLFFITLSIARGARTFANFHVVDRIVQLYIRTGSHFTLLFVFQSGKIGERNARNLFLSGTDMRVDAG